MRHLFSILAISCAVLGTSAKSESATTLSQIDFEAANGYDPAFELAGQQGWEIEGSGGNGLLEDGFGTGGQQAYVGFYPPTNQAHQFTTTWTPLNFDPVAQQQPIVVFSSDLSIRDSMEGGRDDFRWTVFNQDVEHLFTIAFDNSTLKVCYALNDNQGILPTSWAFENEVIYTLTVAMDFENNLWSAYLNSAEIVSNQPISTTNAALTLGDIGAGWFVLDTQNPGDNFMLFDNYTVRAMPRRPSEPSVRLMSREGDASTVRISGQPGGTFALQASSNLKDWIDLGSWLTPSGELDVTDTVSDRVVFYRAQIATGAQDQQLLAHFSGFP